MAPLISAIQPTESHVKVPRHPKTPLEAKMYGTLELKRSDLDVN